jgi:hypothetical protein
MIYSPAARLLYTNLGDPVLGTGLSGAGTVHSNPNALVDLYDACDVWLAVAVATSAGTSPTLDVYLDAQDWAGNWFTQLVHAPQITAGPGQSQVSAGIHITGSGSIVLPRWARITAVVGGTSPVYTGLSISLYGR